MSINRTIRNRRFKHAAIMAGLGLVVALPVLAQAPDLGLGFATATGLAGGDIRTIAGRIINVFLGLLGTVAVVLFMYAGFLYMTAQGNEEQVTKGKKTLVWASLGLVVVFGAYAMVNFVVSTLSKPPTAPPAATAPSG